MGTWGPAGTLSAPAIGRDVLCPGWSPAATQRCHSGAGVLQHRASLCIPGPRGAAGCIFGHAKESKVEVKQRFEAQTPSAVSFPC